MNQTPAQRLLGWTVIAAVIAVAVLAFNTIGSPQHARMIALDRRRESDLSWLAIAIHDRYERTELPATLPVDILTQYRMAARYDPTTDAPYEYHRINKHTYQLCARFDLASEPTGPREAYFWRHGAGHTCYSLDATKAPREYALSATAYASASG